jgi:hypothetical protein
MNPQIEIDDILKHLKEQIATQAQEIAVLKATIDAITKPSASTTAVPLIPNVEGTKGI